MKITDIKDLNHLKTELEKQTTFEFVAEKDILGSDALFLQGLPKKTEITVKLRNYNTSTDNNGRVFASVGGNDNRDGYSGFGCPCDTISEVITALNHHSECYGYVATNKQLMF